MLINFIVLFYQSIMYNQTRNTVRDGLQVAVEKNQDLKGKWQNFKINYERLCPLDFAPSKLTWNDAG